MLDFGNFVYLDLQKTGSTWLVGEFRRICIAKELAFEQHKPYRHRMGEELVTMCISVRHPDSYYLSLFQYGIDRQGGVFKGLESLGLEGVYQPTVDSFVQFLDLLEKESTQTALPSIFPFGHSPRVGLLSQRFLKILGYEGIPKHLPALGEIVELPRLRFGALKKLQFLRQENLSRDLETFVSDNCELFVPYISISANGYGGRRNVSPPLPLPVQDVYQAVEDRQADSLMLTLYTEIEDPRH
jgi:hypothetical protein